MKTQKLAATTLIIVSALFCQLKANAQAALGLSFDAVDDRATIPFNAAYNRGTSTFAIEAWIKADAVQTYAEPTIFSNREAANANTGIQVFLLNGKLTVRTGGTTSTSLGNDLRDGQCHHISIRRNSSSSLFFYIDGTYINYSSGHTQNVNSTHTIWVGQDEPNASTSRFKGVIHELRFWSGQVTIDAAARYTYLNGNENTLLGYWRMNESTGQTLDDLAATNNDGYKGTTTSAEAADPVSVAGCMCTTAAAISSTGGTVICGSAGITLTATTGTGLTYAWLLNGSTISGATSSTYAALTGGTYTCRIFNGNCGNTSNAIVLTSNNPTSYVTYSSSPYICSGNSFLFNASGVNVGTAPTYQWLLNGTAIPGATSTNYSATQQGVYNVLITNTQNGCSAISAQPPTLTVYTTVPSATISFMGSSTSCNSVGIQVAGGFIQGNTYQWQLNGSPISGATSYYIYAGATGSYRCAVTNACGTGYSNTLSATVNGTGNITYSGNTSFCSGSMVLAAPYFWGAAYQWYVGNFPIEGANSYSYTATGSGAYRCMIYTSSCGGQMSANTVTLDGPPVIVAESALSACTGSVTMNLQPGTTATSYQWKLNGSTIVGATGLSYTASTAGVYTCETVSTSCGTKTSNALTVTFGVPTPVTALFPYTGTSNTIDVCFFGSQILAMPCCAGTYRMREQSSAFTIFNQTNNDFPSPGTGYYYIELDNGCGTSLSQLFGVRDVNSMHAVVADGPTSFCSNGNPPNLFVAASGPFFPPSMPFYSPAWDTYSWKVNNTPISGNNPVIQPAQTGWYSCKVSNSCGAAYMVDSLYISVTQQATANVTANGPLTFCQGQSVTFTVGATAGVSYQWYKNGSTISGATGLSYTATTSGTYKVGITNSPCAVIYSADQVVTMTIPFTATVTCNNPIILCSGQTANLQTITGTGYSYIWYLNSAVITGATSSSYTATSSGGYSVKVTDSQGCYSNSAGLLVVSGTRTANITSSNSNPICEGGYFAMNANVSGADITGYQWKLNGNVIPGATSFSYWHYTTAASAGSYTVEVSTSCGTATSAPYILNVNPAPVTPVVSSAGNNYFCTTGSVTLSTPSQSGITYQWYNPNAISGATASSYAATAAGAYFVKATTAQGCNVNSNTLTVYASGFAPSISPNVASACSGFVFTASPATGVTYQWKKGTANISGATAATYSPASTGVYSCVMTGSCGTATSNSVNISEFYTAPLNPSGVIIYPDVTTACTGQSIYIGVNRFVLPPYVNQSTRQWKLNGVAIPGATGTTYYATVPGNYTLDITNACGTTSSNVAALTFNPQATAAITANGPTDLCSGGSVTLSANTATGLTYQWTNNGLTIPGATASTYATTGGGTYRCVVTNSSGCSATSNFINVFYGVASAVTVTPAGPLTVCSGAVVTLSANAGSGISYQWYKSGTAISGATSSTYSVTASGTYYVAESGSCGNFNSNQVVVTIQTPPLKPGAITGTTSACAAGTYTYSVKPQGGTTSYYWTVPSGATINSGQGTTVISVTMPATFTSGTLSVAGVNSCGTSLLSQSLALKTVPPDPTAITGLKSNLCGQSNVTYTVTPVARATGYTWTLPAGVSQVSASGTSITVNYSTSLSGKFCVRANNACGSSASYCSTVSLLPAQPAAVTGAALVCVNQAGVPYSCPTQSGAVYTWTVPTGATVASGQGTGNIQVNFGSTAGTVKVKPSNACGNGTSKSLTVGFNCREGSFEAEAMEQAELNDEVQIYPNPATDQLRFTAFNKELYDRIELVDNLGRKVISATPEQLLLDGWQLKIDFLSEGFYTVVLSGSKQVINLKLVIRR